VIILISGALVATRLAAFRWGAPSRVRFGVAAAAGLASVGIGWVLVVLHA